MSTPETTSRMVERSRAIAAGDTEPQHTEDRSVIAQHGSLYVNITRFASITHDIEEGDTVLIHTVDDGVCVEPDPTTEGSPE